MPEERPSIEESLIDAFARQARRHRMRDAIVAEHRRITYGELDQLSGLIARSLLGHRLQPGQPVAIMTEQGIMQIAAILGVLKAGGLFLPLDGHLGRRRLREIFAHSNAAVILVDHLNHATARLIGGSERPIIDVDSARALSHENGAKVARNADDLACLYYTSGTTGEPKGVVDSDRNVLHNIQRYTSSLNITHDDRLTLVQSSGFSGAVSNIFGALLNGACLLPFDLRARGVAALANWLHQQQPTIYHSVPALFRQLMRHCDTLPGLRIIRLEGDLVRPVDVKIFNRHFDHNCTLVNGLGATETGLTAQHFISRGGELPDAVVPVGKPALDMAIEVVDSQRQALPPGNLGEIQVTSRYLAVGYWRAPEMTAAAFRENEDDTRSYLTGDSGRVNEDGLLEIVGRVDRSAKIRGQWVDLCALEGVLADIGGVHDALAGIVENDSQGREIRAWVVWEPNANITAEDLRDALRAQDWPAHAMPTRIIPVPKWPLDMHGKLDRDALPSGDDRGQHAPPQTKHEHLVADVFEQVLKVTAVSRTDDFFALGGDSLKAVEAGLALNQRTGSQRALSAIQHASTVEGLAAYLEGSVDRDCLVALQPQGSEPALFCVHAHKGHVLNLRNLAEQFAPDRRFFGLQARGLDGDEPPDTTMDEMVESYIAELRKTQPEGPYLLAGYCFGSWVAVEMARKLRQEGQTIGILFLIDPDLPGNMGKQPRKPLSGRAKRWINRVRATGVRGATDFIADWLARNALRVRQNTLAGAVYLTSNRQRLRARLLRRPSDAIAIIHRAYRPKEYDCDAVILVPADSESEKKQPEFWNSYLSGPLEIEFTAGNSADLMRGPYTRDLAARILRRLHN